MKKLLSILAILSLCFMVFSSFREDKSIISDDIKGEVIWEGRGCDYYIIETSRYYVLAELYRGRLDVGNKVVGELHRYGFKEVYNINKDSEVKIYIENYYTSKVACFEWLKEHDKCN